MQTCHQGPSVGRHQALGQGATFTHKARRKPTLRASPSVSNTATTREGDTEHMSGCPQPTSCGGVCGCQTSSSD